MTYTVWYANFVPCSHTQILFGEMIFAIIVDRSRRAGSWSLRALRFESDWRPLVKTAIFSSRNFGAQSGEEFSLYRASGYLWGPGPWGFSLTSLMDDPALRSRMVMAWCINLFLNYERQTYLKEIVTLLPFSVTFRYFGYSTETRSSRK